MSDPEWRWADPHGQQRLIRGDELRAALANGNIPPNAPVWQRGWTEWKPACDVPELTTSALAAANGIVPAIPPPPLFVVAAQSAFEGSPAAPSAGGAEPPPPPPYVPAASKPLVAGSPMDRRPPPTPARTSAPARPPLHTPAPPSPTQLSELGPGVQISRPPASIRTPISQRMSASEALKRSVPGGSRPPVPPPQQRPPVPIQTERDISGSTSASKKPPPVRLAPIATVVGVPRLESQAPSVPVPNRPPSNPRIPVPLTNDGKTPPLPFVTGGPLPGHRTGTTGQPPQVVPKPPSQPQPPKPPPSPGTAVMANPPGQASPVPPPVDRPRGESPRATLLFDGSAPKSASGKSAPPPPIVAPGGGAGEKNAVTRPPPADMGTVQIAGGLPRAEESGEELTGSAILEQELRPRARSIPPSLPPQSRPPKAGPPSTGLRSLAAGGPRPSRPPAPSIDGYENPPGPPSMGTVIGMPALSPPQMRIQTGSGFSPVGQPPSAVPAQVPPPPADLLPPEPAAPPVATPPPALSGAGAPPLETLMGTVGALKSPPPPPADLMAQVRDPSMPSLSDRPPPRLTRPAPEWLKKGVDRALERFPQLRPLQKGRPIFFLPVLAGLTALIGLLFFGLIIRGCVSLISGGDDRTAKRKGDVPTASATTNPSMPASTGAEVTPPAPVASAESAASARTCRLTGVSKTLSQKAVVANGVEAVGFGRSVAFGLTPATKEGLALEVDPGNLAVLGTAKAKRTGEVKHVAPIYERGHLVAAADVDRKDPLAFARTFGGATPFEVGVRDGNLAANPRGAAPSVLWPLPGEGAAEAVRAVPDGAGWAVAFRRNGAIYFGSISKDLKPSGALHETRGLGSQVGSPSIAASNGTLLALWADRAGTDQPWSLRMRRAPAAGALEEAKPFAPTGGPGGAIIAPSAVGLGGGRFFVVWTEGSSQAHQVRGAVLDASGQIEGAPIGISPAGANAGQAQIALAEDGRGVVAYFASGAKDKFELAATTISCAAP